MQFLKFYQKPSGFVATERGAGDLDPPLDFEI